MADNNTKIDSAAPETPSLTPQDELQQALAEAGFTKGVDTEGKPTWTGMVKNPFAIQGDDGSWTFCRKPLDASEENLKLRILAHCFADLFQGNPAAHYVLRDGAYDRVKGSPTESGWNPVAVPLGEGSSGVGFQLQIGQYERHLRGKGASLLSIPIFDAGDGNFNCFFGVIDVDHHLDTDESVDHAALARKVKALNLPLVVCRSKSPKSAHLYLFFKNTSGYSAASAHQLLEYYKRKLEITGDYEIFPKQEVLTGDQIGNGANLPYFGSERVAFGPDGAELSLEAFLCLACKQRSYGDVLMLHDLVAIQKESEPGATSDDQPKTAKAIQEIYEKHLTTFRGMKKESDSQNDQLNKCAWFAARAQIVLGKTETQLTDELRRIAESTHHCKGIEASIRSGWESGISAGAFKVLDPEEAHDEALARINTWLDCQIELSNEDALESLALLTDEEYSIGDLREKSAKRLHMSKVTKLDEFVRKRRPKEAKGTSEGELDIQFKSCEPWRDPVDGAELLANIASLFRRFIVFKQRLDPEVMATWSLATHLYPEFSILSRLGFTSPFPECGKTTCIDLMEHLCLRAVRADNISTSIAFRIMDGYHPTLLLDELDTYLGENKEMQGVLNSGHRKGGFVWRVSKEDDRQKMERFATYGPVAFGMIGHPSTTLFSRTIFIRLERKSAKQVTEDFDPDEKPEQAEEMTVLRRKIVRWCADNRAGVKDCNPDTGTLSNRSRNNWRPLLKIAQVAGGEWTKIILTAAGSPPPPSKKSEQEKLLRDVRNIFHSRKIDRLPSVILVSDLLYQKESGWTRHHGGRENLDEADLADLLIDFGVEPKPLNLNKEAQGKLYDQAQEKSVTKRGYLLAQFQPLFDTYLSGKAEEVQITPRSPF